MRNLSRKSIGLFCLLCIGVNTSVSAQLYDKDLNVDENKLRIEFEPGLFFNNGRSLNAMYNFTDNTNFTAGIYLMASDVPEEFHSNMFDNVVESTHIRASVEYAFTFRYRFNLAKNLESDPYLGLILGWEEINLAAPGMDNLKYTTFLITPHIGYELYLYKKMLYLNTQIRSVFYVGAKKSDESRPETIRSYWILPSIGIGLRI